MSWGRYTDSYFTRSSNQGSWWSLGFEKRSWIFWSSNVCSYQFLEFLSSKTFLSSAKPALSSAKTAHGKYLWLKPCQFCAWKTLPSVSCFLLEAGSERHTKNTLMRGSEVWLKTDCPIRRKKTSDCLCSADLGLPKWARWAPISLRINPPSLQPPASVWSLEQGPLRGSGPAVCSAGNHTSGGAICPLKSHQSLTWLPESSSLQDRSEVADPS